LIDLNPRQAEVLKKIRAMTRKNGHTPNFRELQKAMGFASVNSVFRYVKALEQKGYLRTSNRANSLQLVEPN
jgi:repressor LexA